MRCAIPKCDKVFTNESFNGNAQMFPDPVNKKELYNMWLKIIGSPVLMAMTPEILRKTYVVCNKHFDKDNLLEDETKLADNTIPTKGLPSKNLFPYCVLHNIRQTQYYKITKTYLLILQFFFSNKNAH